jgi:hypothetical protein
MWMVQILEDGDLVVFLVSGRLEREQLAELQRALELRALSRNTALDLKDVKLVDREAVRFLAQRERGGAQLRNCPGYIREWITKENEGKEVSVFSLVCSGGSESE